MGKAVKFDYQKAEKFITRDELRLLQPAASLAKDELVQKKWAGQDFLGWLDLPVNYDKEEFEKIKKVSEKIRKTSDILLVIGIGGSYLGARAAIDFLGHNFYNIVSREVRNAPEIYFVGHNMSCMYIQQLKDVIGERDFSINVISKSGMTTESAIAFRIFKKMMEEKYGKRESAERIYVTTDKEKGALKEMSEMEGYETFIVPDDVGGRFSVLTPVGLLPIAVSGIDIQELMDGAKYGRELAFTLEGEENAAVQYALFRNLMSRKGKYIEILANYEPSAHFIGEWWKQLYGESEGKDQKGIFPATVDLTTDLHAMGQYIQDGGRILFETILNIEESRCNLVIERDEDNLDGLNYLAGKTVDYVNKSAMYGTMLAHTDGNVPNVMISIPKQDAFNLGQLFYFFQFSCGISGYLLGVNPFNQPGVEMYKTNMFALLGKPGHELERERLVSRL